MKNGSATRAPISAAPQHGPSQNTGEGSDGFRGVRGGVSTRGTGLAACRGVAYEVLDVVDFGGAVVDCKVDLDLGRGPANAGRLLLRRADAVKDRHKRWHADKIDSKAGPALKSSGCAHALAVHLEARQPLVSTIVTRSMAASAAQQAAAKEAEIVGRRFVKAGRK